jgi:uncharacterized protein (DUF2252 family)
MVDVLGPLAADDAERTTVIVDGLTEASEPLMHADQAAFRAKFRKMAADPFAFYRGSACVFYADIARLDDRWVDDRGSRTWIQGDLHAENFGTYLDSDGRLVFDVNDFDEAYLGHWTWDLQRFAASLALLGWRKALPDEVIADLIERFARGYLDQVEYFVSTPDDTHWALTLDTATGAVLDALHAAKLQTRVRLLDSVTVVDGYLRTFAHRAGVRRLDDDERDLGPRRVHRLPGHHSRRPAQGRSDLRRARRRRQVRIRDRQCRTARLQRADRGLHAGAGQRRRADPEAGQRRGAQPGRRRAEPAHPIRTPRAPDRPLPARPAGARRPFPGLGHLARERTPDRVRGQRVLPLSNRSRLGRDHRTRPDRTPGRTVGRATAKIHCVSDDESEEGIVDFSVEEVIAGTVDGRDEDFVAELVQFAHAYARRAQDDHRLFVETFRPGGFALVNPTRS